MPEAASLQMSVASTTTTAAAAAATTTTTTTPAAATATATTAPLDDGENGSLLLSELHRLAVDSGVLAVVGAPVTTPQGFTLKTAAPGAQRAHGSGGGGGSHDGGGDYGDHNDNNKPLLGAVALGGANGPVVYGKVHVHSTCQRGWG